MTDKLTDANRAALRRVSTATLSTLLFKRGFRNTYVQGVSPLNPEGRRMVGEAFTLRYIPAREDLDRLEAFRDPEHPQRQAIERCPEGHVLVMDSRQDASGASGGSILLTRLYKRGVEGVVTDGGFRDAGPIAELPMPAFHQRPSAPTNLTMNHALDINNPIACGGVAVYPGDIIVGDSDGVVVMPAHVANDIAEEAAGMEDFETFVTEEVMAGRTIIGLYPPNEQARADYERWREGRGGE